MHLRSDWLITSLLLAAALLPGAVWAADPPADKTLHLQGRYREAEPAGQLTAGQFAVKQERLDWDPTQTAIVICDMWNEHWCKGATTRVAEMAPRMNQFVAAARDRGVLIVHAPSECTASYADTPARKRVQSAPAAANLPKDIGGWCKQIPAEEKGVYPIDQSDGGCDDDPPCPTHNPWKREIDALAIDQERDAISDSGTEIWNLLESRGISNVMVLGVHTNMCVLGRPFGLRQMVRNGKHVVLVRDLTDTMYNHRSWPFVNHFQGTDLIVQHVERFVCPTITSDQLLGGAPFRFKADVRLIAMLIVSEPEYQTAETLPVFGQNVLQDQLGFEVTFLKGDPARHELPGMADALGKADLVLLSVRRQALAKQDIDALRKYLADGKPLLGIRTASHAFDARGGGPAGHVEWPTFDPEVLGGHYHGHYDAAIHPSVKIAGGAAEHPILIGVQSPFDSHYALYQTSPLAASATPLLVGAIPDKALEPVAWVNTSGKSRVFYTSLGGADDFKNPQFVRLLGNAAMWATGQEVRSQEKPMNNSKKVAE